MNNVAHRASFALLALTLSLTVGFCAEGIAAESATVTPREQLSRVPNLLDELPTDWATTMPIQLDVAFNLKYAPNSPEAEQFIETYQRSITALPDRLRLRFFRTIVPAKYHYMVSLGFRNWAEYRAYESSTGFLKYYREQWRPAVTDIEERLYVVDPVTSR